MNIKEEPTDDIYEVVDLPVETVITEGDSDDPDDPGDPGDLDNPKDAGDSGNPPTDINNFFAKDSFKRGYYKCHLCSSLVKRKDIMKSHNFEFEVRPLP